MNCNPYKLWYLIYKNGVYISLWRAGWVDSECQCPAKIYEATKIHTVIVHSPVVMQGALFDSLLKVLTYCGDLSHYFSF